MFRKFQNSASFKNFKRAGNLKGQVSTVLIITTVVLLVFTMVTLNIGETSLSATRLSNAADSAALTLASQLSTRARQLSEGIVAAGGSPTQVCKKTSLTSLIGAIIVAIVMIVATWGAASPVAMGMIGGAIGGAIGGEIAGTGAGRGAVQGAIVGMAVGSIAAGGLHTMSSSTVQGGASGVTAGGAPVGAGEVVVCGGKTVIGTSAGTMTLPAGTTITGLSGGTAAISIPAGMGTLAVGALSITATTYTASVNQKMEGEMITQLVDMLNKLDFRTRIRETTFLGALGQLVDDPNISSDDVDSNRNGNYTELVPDFQKWMFQRFSILTSLAGLARNAVDTFMSWMLGEAGWIESWILYGEDWQLTNSDGTLIQAHWPGSLENEDYKVVTDAEGNEAVLSNAGNDGNIVKLLRALERGGHNVSFWDPGPTPAELQAAAECCDDSCDAPAGYDALDSLYDTLREMNAWVYALDKQDPQERTNEAADWFPYFYLEGDSLASPTSYYFVLGRYKEDFDDWKEEIRRIVEGLPECVVDEHTGNVAECPCKYNGNYVCITQNFYDGEDAHWPFYWAVEDLGWEVEYAQNIIKQHYDELYGISSDSGASDLAEFGGAVPNVITYDWTDSRGGHVVRVQTGPFQTPRTEQTSHGKWYRRSKCMNLVDYTDGGKCWVKITKVDDTQKMGPLGFWNLFRGGVTKSAKAYYSYDRVGLKD